MSIKYKDLYEDIEHHVDIIDEDGMYILVCNECGMDIMETGDSAIGDHVGHDVVLLEEDTGNIVLKCLECDNDIVSLEPDSIDSSLDSEEYDDEMWDSI